MYKRVIFKIFCSRHNIGALLISYVLRILERFTGEHRRPLLQTVFKILLYRIISIDSLNGLISHSGQRNAWFGYTDIQTESQTDRQKDIQTDIQTDRQTGRLAGRQAGRQAERETDKQTDRQTKRQTDRETNRQAG